MPAPTGSPTSRAMNQTATGYGALIASMPDIQLHELTASLIQPHLTGAPANYNRTAQLIAAILNFARRKGYLDSVPTLERKKVAPSVIRWSLHCELVH